MRILSTAIGVMMLASASFQVSADVSLGTKVQCPTPEGRFTAPSFSADSSAIAYARQGFSGLFVSSADGKITAISEQPLSGWRYSWSADGKKVFYRVRYGETPALAGMISAADGGPAAQVTDWQNDLYPPVRTKSGITFKAGDDVITLNEQGSVKGTKSLSRGIGTVSRIASISAALAANGLSDISSTALAAMVPVTTGSPNPQDVLTTPKNDLVVADADGRIRKLIDVAMESGFYSPKLSPAGDMVAAPALSGNLYLTNTAGSDSVNLGKGQNPSWSPDGKYLVYEVVKENGHNITSSDLWVASSDGRWKKQLTNTPELERYPSWSPDGTKLVFEVDGKIFYAPIQE